MTSQKDQIQALIADIDGVLQKTTPRLPWVMTGEVAQQRQTLERVRNYLVSLQRRMAIQDGYGQINTRPDLLAHDISYRPTQSPQTEFAQENQPQEMTAQQMLQTVMQEMSYLRTNLMQPLQADLESLSQRREALEQEIRQLETQRQSYGSLQPQANQQQLITDFLQALMGRLQETLPQQIAQSLRSAGDQSLLQGANPLVGGTPVVSALPGSYYPPLQAEQSLQPTADQLVVHLDSTLKVIFESLERNVQAYQESLSQGLDRMHGLGQQGEMMFTALINHLAQQLGREASSYLQSSKQFVDLGTAEVGEKPSIATSPEETKKADLAAPESDRNPNVSPALDDSFSNLRLPYPGTEMPVAAVSEATAAAELVAEPSPPATSVDAAIDAWLKSASATSGVSFENPDLSNLDLPGLNLADLDLNQIDTQEIEALLEMETGSDAEDLAEEAESSEGLPFPGTSFSIEDADNRDAALKLLEQLNFEPDEPENISLEDAEVEIDRILSSAEPPSETTTDSKNISDDARDELDEFYESLFGSEAEGFDFDEDELSIAPEPTETTIKPNTSSKETIEEPAVNLTDPTLGWDLTVHNISPKPEISNPVSREPSSLDTLELETALNVPPTSHPSELEEPSVTSISDLLGEREEAAIDPQPATSPKVNSTDLPITSENQISSLTDLFEDVIAPESSFQPESSLTLAADKRTEELVKTPDFGTLQPADSSDQDLVSQAEILEEQYTPASPEEDLLPANESSNEPDPRFWLDEITLNSLSEDLSSLEADFGQVAQTPGTEEIPTANESTLDDWETEAPNTIANDEFSLQDLADSLAGETPATTVVKNTVQSIGQATDVFTLEGMDDLFEESPPTPLVSPVPPPASSALDDSAFTLENMGGLFADLPSAPTVSPVPPPSSTVLTDQPADSISESTELPLEPPASSSTVSSEPSVDEPVPFTLEGMDDLFADVPSLMAPPSELAPTSVEGILSPPVSSKSSIPFTLEGLDDLFADVVPAQSSQPQASANPSTQLDTSTLEGMGDLFTDAPSADPTFSPEPVEPIASSPPLEDTPPADSTPPAEPVESIAHSDQPAPFTLEHVGDVLMEVPIGAMVEPPPSEKAPKQPQAFTLEQMGDVFMEVPTTSPEASPSPPEPAALEPKAREKKKKTN